MPRRLVRLTVGVSIQPAFRLVSMLCFHTISKEVKTERNTLTRLKAAGDHASRLGVFRARDMVVAGYPREYLRRLVSQLRYVWRNRHPINATAHHLNARLQKLHSRAQVNRLRFPV